MRIIQRALQGSISKPSCQCDGHSPTVVPAFQNRGLDSSWWWWVHLHIYIHYRCPTQSSTVQRYIVDCIHRRYKVNFICVWRNQKVLLQKKLDNICLFALELNTLVTIPLYGSSMYYWWTFCPCVCIKIRLELNLKLNTLVNNNLSWHLHCNQTSAAASLSC